MTNTIKLKRGTGSDPSASDMVLGEPVLRTDTAELFFKKDNGTVAKVSGGGGGGASFYINTLSSSSNTGGGSASFNGTAYRFTLSNAPATGNAAQMLVSVGGVIQKANSGTSQPSEGYAISGDDIIFGAAPASAASWFIITYGALNAGTPTDNTVTTAKIVDDAVTGAKLSNNLDIPDGNKIRFGTGNDLQIYHDSGGNSYITESGSGSLVIKADDFYVQLPNSNNLMRVGEDEKVELFHDGSKKFETASHGIEVTGKLTFSGDGHTQGIELGSDADIVFYHDNSDGYLDNNVGDLYLRNDGSSTSEKVRIQAKGGEQSIVATANGSVELYYDNTKRFQTSSGGCTFYGWTNHEDNGKAYFGTGNEFQIWHNGNDSVIRHTSTTSGDDLWIEADTNIFIGKTSGAESMAKFIADGAVELYHNNVKRLETTAYGVQITGSTYIDDSSKGYFGTGNEFQVYHSGSDSFVNSDTGQLYVRSDNNVYIQPANGENGVVATANGAVELYYDGSKKFETTSSGVSVTGQLSVSNTHFNYGSGSNYITQADDQVTYFRNTTGTIRSRIHSDGSYRTEDNVKIVLGTGQDCGIFHDGTNTMIDNDTGELKISSSTLRLRGNTLGLYNENQTEPYVICSNNGSVDLYYDNSKKFETTSSSVKVHGHVDVQSTGSVYLQDNGKVQLGTGQDVEFYFDSTHLRLHNSSGGNFSCKSSAYYFNDQLGLENCLDVISNGAVKLYYDGSKKLESTSYGTLVTGRLTTTGNITAPDSAQIQLGDNIDLAIYHSGTYSYIKNSHANGLWVASDLIAFTNAAVSENLAKFTANGSVELYYDHGKKFETTSEGAKLTGNLYVDGGSGNNAIIHNSNNGGIDFRADNGGFVFQTYVSSWKTRLSVVDNGDVYIGNSDTTGGHLFIYGKDGNDEPAVIEFHGKNGSGGGNPKAQIKGQYNTYAWASDLRFFTQDHNINLTEHFRIDFQGNLTATDTTIGSISDSRLKTNIADYTYDLTKFKQFQPKTFDWKNPVQHGSKSGVRGFLAQDLEAVDSVYVSNCLVDKTVTKGNADGTTTTSTHPDLQYLESDGIAKSSKFGEKDAMYISVINQLIAKIETLETKVAALEAA